MSEIELLDKLQKNFSDAEFYNDEVRMNIKFQNLDIQSQYNYATQVLNADQITQLYNSPVYSTNPWVGQTYQAGAMPMTMSGISSGIVNTSGVNTWYTNSQGSAMGTAMGSMNQVAGCDCESCRVARGEY
jgi:hypothetical protein